MKEFDLTKQIASREQMMPIIIMPKDIAANDNDGYEVYYGR